MVDGIEEKELYAGIKSLVDSSERLKYYTEKARIRGRKFEKQITVKAVEQLMEKLT